MLYKANILDWYLYLWLFTIFKNLNINISALHCRTIHSEHQMNIKCLSMTQENESKCIEQRWKYKVGQINRLFCFYKNTIIKIINHYFVSWNSRIIRV